MLAMLDRYLMSGYWALGTAPNRVVSFFSLKAFWISVVFWIMSLGLNLLLEKIGLSDIYIRWITSVGFLLSFLSLPLLVLRGLFLHKKHREEINNETD